MGGKPGIVPGQMALGKISFCAGAPSMIGGTFRNPSSSVGNLNPASLKALPKSFSLGKSEWHVAHEVWYWRAKAGIAWLAVGSIRNSSKPMQPNPYCVLMEFVLMRAPYYV